MMRTIQLHHLAFVTVTVAAMFVGGCELKIDNLDAGLDDESGDGDGDGDGGDALECLIGTQLEAVGTQQSSWSPGCAVECSAGWGHPGGQLAIAWTSSISSFPEAPPAQPRAIGLLANGRIVVASAMPNAVFFNFFEPDGLNIGGYDAYDLGKTIYGVELDSHVAYITHGDEDGTITISATDLDSQQELWRQEFPGVYAYTPARGGGKIAFSLKFETEPEQFSEDLVVLDLDGELLWRVPSLAEANPVAFSPSGARIAVAGEKRTRVYTADGEILDEFVHAGLGLAGIYPQAVTFADEDRVITVGAGSGISTIDGWLAGDSLAGAASWEQVYTRADSWCPEPEDDEFSGATAEWLTSVDALPDGTLVVVGTESFDSSVVSGSHPWVARFTAEGGFVASDRGLWDGGGADAVVGPDGSVFALTLDNPAIPDSGFHVRKYVQ